MTIRTQRRRISPRTKKRYRAVKEFFKKALGGSSQEIKINSSIAINVSHLKHQIGELEEQLNEVDQHCRELAGLENSFRKPNGQRFEEDILREHPQPKFKTNKINTKVLYKKSEDDSKTDDSENAANIGTLGNNKHIKPDKVTNSPYPRPKKRPELKSQKCDPTLHKHKTQSACENLKPNCKITRYHSMEYSSLHPRGDQARNHKHKQKDYIKTELLQGDQNRNKESKHKSADKHKRRKNKAEIIDHDFIADIIRKQYKPLTLFGRRDSRLSQCSAPFCRDQEFHLNDDLRQGDLCSCCCDNRHVTPAHISDNRSICDTRLYSCKRNYRKRHKRQEICYRQGAYDDEDLYDLVPVKEKSSPKSRRKFVEDNMTPYGIYKEVPPSPKSLRPRLNLKAQSYQDYNDMVEPKVLDRNYTLNRYQVSEQSYDNNETDLSSEIVYKAYRRKKQKSALAKPVQVQTSAPIQDTANLNGLPSPIFGSNQLNGSLNFINSNKIQSKELSADKTDKAMCEIKDILQNLLQEIKKDSTTSDTATLETRHMKQNSIGVNNTNLNNGDNNLNFITGTCNTGFMPQVNPCCYPVIPMCPINPMVNLQNGYMFPCTSNTCHPCTENNETFEQGCSADDIKYNIEENNQTDDLIKEIHKLVAQNPNYGRNKQFNDQTKREVTPNRILTSRSAGESIRMCKHDVQVGTPVAKCYSRSCEAIGCPFAPEKKYSGTHTTHSDMVMEKPSFDGMLYMSEPSSSCTTIGKKKRFKICKVLRSFCRWKKKKRDIIEDEMRGIGRSEESHMKTRSPYNQNYTNYMMYGQTYDRVLPVPPFARDSCRPPHHGNRDAPHPYHDYNHGMFNNPNIADQGPPDLSSHVYPDPQFTNRHLNSRMPQVPLCFKEVEVKSTATQSEKNKKMSFFGMFAKNKRIVQQDPRKSSTETSRRPGLFSGLKSSQEQSKTASAQGKRSFGEYTTTYTDSRQYNLEKEGNTLKKMLLKKLFYKRNPFSPRNLIVRTILGKEEPNYERPAKWAKPRLFM